MHWCWWSVCHCYSILASGRIYGILIWMNLSLCIRLYVIRLDKRQGHPILVQMPFFILFLVVSICFWWLKWLKIHSTHRRFILEICSHYKKIYSTDSFSLTIIIIIMFVWPKKKKLIQFASSNVFFPSLTFKNKPKRKKNYDRKLFENKAAHASSFRAIILWTVCHGLYFIFVLFFFSLLNCSHRKMQTKKSHNFHTNCV